jgi:hypothetical protein
VFGKNLSLPSSLLGTTKALEWDCTSAPCCFYRVIAVDSEGIRSVPTPIVQLPTPALLPVELPAAVVGQRYQGDLPARYRTGRFAWALRDGLITDLADRPNFTLLDDGNADWLTIDPATGRLSGTPTRKETASIVVGVETKKGKNMRRTYRLDAR